MSQEIIATTLPIGPRSEKPKLGLMVNTLITDVLARRNSNVVSRPAFNLYDSYWTRDALMEPMLEANTRLGINTDARWVDTDHAVELMEQFESLHRRGFVRERMADVLICDEECRRVEMLASAPVYSEARVYTVQNGEVRCNNCNSVCREVEKPTLVMSYPEGLQSPQVYPNKMQRDVDELTRRIAGSEVLISRARPTGIEYAHYGNSFNIDVDFFWMNYLNTLDPEVKRIALVGSSHVRRHLTNICALFSLHEGAQTSGHEARIILPNYILKASEGEDFVNGGYQTHDLNLVRLFTAASISFNKDIQWPMQILKGMQRKYSPLEFARVDSSDLSTDKLSDLDDQLNGLFSRANIQNAINSQTDLGDNFDIRGLVI